MDIIFQISFSQLISGILTITSLLGILQWLLIKWMGIRLEKSIQHEYDRKIESIKNILKDQYDLSKTEREFYDQMVETINNFFGELKKYQFKNNIKSATKANVLENEELKNKYFVFIDSINEFIEKSYVFLKEENYTRLHEALNSSTDLANLANNLLDAMRRSIYPDTKLNAKEKVKEFHY